MAAEALEQSMLESKDKDQLLAIAQALGITATARVAKATLISKILETTGSGPDESPTPARATTNGDAGSGTAKTNGTQAAPPAPAYEVVLGPDGEPLPDWEVDLIKKGEVDSPGSGRPGGPRPNGPRNNGGRPGAPARTPRPASADGEAGDDGDDDDDEQGNSASGQGDGESRNARRRRRRRGKPRTDGPQGYDRQEPRQGGDRGERAESSEPQNFDPVAVSGYLDLREEGYGFLRVNGYLASREDAYIPVKLTRQYGLRKGDHVTGMSRPAGRNEKNPALLEIHTVNDADPEKAKGRRRFEDLTALFPDEKLNLENAADPNNMTARIVDLVSPIGKGQRGIIVSPPKAGKTTIMKTIATSIEANNPEVKLIVLLIDERPEEVTDMRRTVKGEVISSTFDRPSDEHTQVAELALEKAKRLVEAGHDVVIILDGITRLSRAYNLAAPASGRILSGGIDAGALYPPKRFFGAARNVEEGGSLTILATALVETNSRMDEAIFEEFKGTGNMELRLDRRLAERRIYPAIDVDASSTRHEELLFDRKQLQMVWKLRRVLSGLAADGNAAPGLELLMDRLRTFRTNDEFLNEIAKQPSM
ncbi:MAG: transcription termination factor Rho [Ilumatobacteraceae bacterium]